jgi:YegS/Rv2252/BmrU family lipid kinase
MQNEKNLTWHVILNPHAGAGKASRDRKKIMDVLQNSDLSYVLHISEFPGHAIQIAKALAYKGETNFIAAGGDGTLNEIVNGFFNGRGMVPANVIIGMIPVGTGNDWIKTFGIPDDYEKAMKIILEGKKVTQDVGEINFSKDGTEVKRYFVNIAGFGFDGLVASNANSLKAKGISGFRVYVESLFSSFLRFNARKTIIEIDGAKIEKNLFSASIGIGKYNGGGMMQVPEANPVQGVFHITLISKIGLWGILMNFRGLYSGRFIRDRRVSTYTGKNIAFHSQEQLPGEADGETLGEGDFRITILPQGLTVLCGETDFE